MLMSITQAIRILRSEICDPYTGEYTVSQQIDAVKMGIDALERREPTHYWLPRGGHIFNKRYYCSCCGQGHFTEEMTAVGYCPVCGAGMNGKARN